MFLESKHFSRLNVVYDSECQRSIPIWYLKTDCTFTLRNSQLEQMFSFFFVFKFSWNIKTFQLLFIILERFRSSLRRHVQELNTNQLNISSPHAKIRNTLHPYVGVFTEKWPFNHLKLSFQGYYTHPQSHPNEAHLPSQPGLESL